MWAIVGLGNPGRKYSRTRHNIGFMVIEEITRRYEIKFKEKDNHRIGRGFIDGEEILLIEPLLFMNMSGIVVKDILSKFEIPLKRLIIIHDDLDMQKGKVRIRRKGSSGGHKGIESIIQSVSSKDFVRLKIGIGRAEGVDPEDYVLNRFRRSEIPLIKKTIEKASEAVTSILTEGIEKAMNRFNTD
jgi:PTH1 family peptidyl-tRNA hydrolase